MEDKEWSWNRVKKRLKNWQGSRNWEVFSRVSLSRISTVILELGRMIRDE
jgi:hypothetical protein